jgi:hypothetical protein
MERVSPGAFANATSGDTVFLFDHGYAGGLPLARTAAGNAAARRARNRARAELEIHKRRTEVR